MEFAYTDICLIEDAPSRGAGATPREMTLGEQLRAVRQAAGKTQEDLVAEGVAGQSTISEMENGKRPTGTDVLERWVQACGAELVVRRHDDPDPLTPLVRAARALRSHADLARLVRIAIAFADLGEKSKETLTAAIEGAAEDVRASH